MPAGRPSKYNQELVEKALEYANGAWEDIGPVPSVVGMCNYIGIAKPTAYDWKDHPDKEQFSNAFKKVEQKQEEILIKGGLGGTFAPTITKLMMTNHGYSDKVQQDHTSSDKSMSTPTVIRLAGPDDD